MIYALRIDEETIFVPTWTFRHRLATVTKHLRGFSELIRTLQDHARTKAA